MVFSLESTVDANVATVLMASKKEIFPRSFA